MNSIVLMYKCPLKDYLICDKYLLDKGYYWGRDMSSEEFYNIIKDDNEKYIYIYLNENKALAWNYFGSRKDIKTINFERILKLKKLL